MTSDKIKFFVLKYMPRRCWSKEKHSYFNSENIENQVWAHENMPLSGDLVDIYELVNILRQEHDGEKIHRDAICSFEVNKFPIKEQIDLSKWNGVIRTDFDNGKDPLMMKLTKEQHISLFDHLNYALQLLIPDHFMYIERSSTWTNWHILFYFDCKKDEENFKRCAQFVYELFRYRIDEYIKDFSHIFTNPDCLKDNGKSTIFDEVYNRPYQKFYMTGIDYVIHNCSGCMDDVKIEHIEENKDKYDHIDEVNADGSWFNIKYNNNKTYELDHNDRFYVITALKRYCKNRDTAYKLYYDFCQKLKLYKNYTTKDFINQFEREYDKADENAGHISILKKYGFNIDDHIVHFNLKENEYLDDIIENILKYVDKGITLLEAPTAGGKTTVWKNINKRILSDPLLANNKNILVIEPMNSIINSKYEGDDVILVNSKQKIKTLNINLFNTYSMVVTNYNHCIRRCHDGSYTIKESFEEILKKCDLLIVDESHIMLKDIFRSNVLIEFMETLNRYSDSTKIIIQTATPMFEKHLLNIKRHIIVEKPLNKKVKYIFREVQDDKFEITDITCLCDYYISNGRKVYVYWNNGAFLKMTDFQVIFGKENVMIYHKRDEGSDDMNYLNQEHLFKKKLMMSSVYFGVGNDLNDEDPAAVIIIGNNTYQEDVQAIGRWRNSKDIEVCQILLPEDRELFRSTLDYKKNAGDIISNRKWYWKQLWKDKYNRNKSYIVGSTAYQLIKDYYCDYIGVMEGANIYFSQACVKIDYFKKLGYDVRTEIKPLLQNIDWIDKLKTLRDALRKHRNEVIKKMINGIDCYDEINKDGKLSRLSRIIKKLRQHDLLKYVERLDHATSGMFLNYEPYLAYYEKEFFSASDYGELYSMIWYRNNINQFKKKKFVVMEQVISGEEYCMLYSYLIWWMYRNKQEDDSLIVLDYYNKFKYNCECMSKIPEIFIDKIFEKLNTDTNTDIFFNQYINNSVNEVNTKIDNEVIQKDTLLNTIRKINASETDIIKVVDCIVNKKKITYSVSNSNKIKNKKCITITKDFPKLEKYKLKVGQFFESQKELAKYCDVDINTVTKWKKKQWI